MRYDKFAGILNESIFVGSKAKLIDSIAKNPLRYVGLFRPTKPRAKLLQNILQSQEIRMGDALEEIVRGYLEEGGCELLDGGVVIEGEEKNIDLHFRKGGDVFVIEQKIRDDHDSTKKKGQFRDLSSKLEYAVSQNGAGKTRGGVFFVDPSLNKNRNYYSAELEALARKHNGLRARLWYGEEFFADILGGDGVWDEMLSHLRRWKENIPLFPEVNFDATAEKSFGEIKDISPSVFLKIFKNDSVRDEILPVIFPGNEVLGKLLAHFNGSRKGEAALRDAIKEQMRRNTLK